jgi:hypothetical protein
MPLKSVIFCTVIPNIVEFYARLILLSLVPVLANMLCLNYVYTRVYVQCWHAISFKRNLGPKSSNMTGYSCCKGRWSDIGHAVNYSSGEFASTLNKQHIAKQHSLFCNTIEMANSEKLQSCSHRAQLSCTSNRWAKQHVDVFGVVVVLRCRRSC